MSTVGLDGQLADRDGRHRRARDRRRGPVQRAAAVGGSRPHLGVGEDRQLPVGQADQQGRGVRVAEPARGLASRQIRLAERRWAHDGRHRGGADIEQPVDGVAGAGEAHAHRLRDVGRSRLGPEQPPGVAGAEQSAGGRLARAHRERRGHPAQQRGVTEALARPERLDHLALVPEVHRAGQDHPQPGRPGPVLDEHRLSGGEALPAHRLRDGAQLAGVEGIERRMVGQEGIEVLDVGRRRSVGMWLRVGARRCHGASLTGGRNA